MLKLHTCGDAQAVTLPLDSAQGAAAPVEPAPREAR